MNVTEDMAFDFKVTTTQGTERIARAAFDFAKKNGIYSVKIDPPVPLKITPPELDESEYFTPFSKEISESVSDYIFNAGFSYKELSLVLNDYIQPRFNMIVPLAKKNGEKLSTADFKKHFKSSERKYMGAFSVNRGMFFEEAEITDENIDLFADIMKSTGERKSIFLRNREYFKRLLLSFGDSAKLFFEKTDIDIYIKYLNDRKAKETEDEKVKTEELLAAAEKVKMERGQVIPLSVSDSFPSEVVTGSRYTSLSHTVGPCCLSVLCLVRPVSVNPKFLIDPSPTFPFGNHLFFYVYESVL